MAPAISHFDDLAAVPGALGHLDELLRNWEQGRRRPEGPALALLRIAARHPGVLQENRASPE